MAPLQLVKRMVKTLVGLDLFLTPQIRIPFEFHGEEHAGFALYPDSLNAKSIVYSVGVGDNISFDLSLISKYSAQIFAFDPTPRCLRWIKGQTLPTQFHFSPVGLAAHDGEITFYAPPQSGHVSFSTVRKTAGEPVVCQVQTLKSLAKDLGHSRIDVLKIDIEGSEYDVIPNVLSSGVEIGQVLVEFHHRNISRGAGKTKAAIALLNEHGFKLFAVSDSGEEMSFVHCGLLEKGSEKK